MKYLGCSYNPEIWGVERVKIDAALMKDVGINMVRIGEFAWSRIEPEEGFFTLDWLHKILDTLGKHGINVLMCTPTAAPPVWLTHNYLETMKQDMHGHSVGHGVRHQCCYSSPKFRELCAAVTEKLTTELGKHKNIIGWQIENEPGCSSYAPCECKICQHRFHEWLKDRYQTIEKLNESWGNKFWSGEYHKWEEIALGSYKDRHSPSRVFDSTQFRSDLVREFIMEEAVIVRKNAPECLVTTNNPNSYMLDNFQLFTGLDVASADVYFQGRKTEQGILSMDMYRSYRKDLFWLTETSISDNEYNGSPELRRFRPDFWSAFARGADMFSVFQWRFSPGGIEHDAVGVLTHSGAPRHNYKEVQRVFNEYRSLKKDTLENLPLPNADAAVYYNIHDIRILVSGRLSDKVRIGKMCATIHEQMFRRGITLDFVCPDEAFEKYPLFFLPAPVCISQDFGQRLKRYIENGGCVFSMGPVGIFDDNAKYLTSPHPEIITEVWGARFYDGHRITKSSTDDIGVLLGGMLDNEKVDGQARGWIGDIEIEKADSVLCFKSSIYKTQPALLIHKLGDGCVIHLAVSDISDQLFDKILLFAIRQAKIENTLTLPSGLEVVRRGELTFLINRATDPVVFPLSNGVNAILGKFEKGFVHLQPFDVAIIQEPIKQTVKGGAK